MEVLRDVLRRDGVATLHLGTQTAGHFYIGLGYRVTHRLVQVFRMRATASGQRVDEDLVMLRLDLQP